jgi:pimeloyl-ACP methyl ester carboxylesterase
VAVIHGGPGAGGEMAEVAVELCSGRSILEPLQTARSLPAQVEELKGLLEQCAQLPVTLIGFSWGAWLSFILAARYPAMVKKLVLIGCGPFEDRYVPAIMQARLSRLSDGERRQLAGILEILNGPDKGDREKKNKKNKKNRAFHRLGELLSRADAFDPIKPEKPQAAYPSCRVDNADSADSSDGADIYQSVWKEASHLRQTGELLQLGEKISCSVVAMHGDWDPHPAGGVREPLQAVLKSFQFILLEECGHKPWMERRAKDKFYSLLKKSID